MLRNQVQLITYPDSLGGRLSDVYRFLKYYTRDSIGGVHILPFYPSSADRGFAPLTHLSVDPKFGTWADIRALGREYDLVADLTVNHLSCKSPYFQDFLAHGDESKYAGLFLDVYRYLDRHHAELKDLDSTYRPRPTPPCTEFVLADGTTRTLWTTFTEEQVDLDVTSDVTKRLMVRFIDKLVENGVDLLRLDAAGYAAKAPGTTSFLIPETYEFLRWIRSVTPERIELLAEVHHEAGAQRQLLEANAVEWAYDFSLPLLTLHALYDGTNHNLMEWIAARPSQLITTLDTHDGIGVVDVAGLMSNDEIARTKKRIEDSGAAEHTMRARGTDVHNVDVYQINSTYFSALGTDEHAYITARALQYFVPGIPQIYYVGLLAGTNDYTALHKTNEGRSINRHNYTWPEIDAAIKQPVVERLLELTYLRSHHPAFQGTFSCEACGTEALQLRWDYGDIFCAAHVDLLNKTVTIEMTNPRTGSVEERRY